MVMREQEFRALGRTDRIEALRDGGIAIGQRTHRGFSVRLFAIGAIYVEVWFRLGFETVEWVEIIPSARVADVYGPSLEKLNL